MKRSVLIFILALLSLASGYLMSHATWISKVGITFFHREWNFIKVWWQGALAVFIIMLVLFALHTFIQNRLQTITARITHFCLLIAAKTALYLSSEDMSNTLAHRMLGWRFHYGFYIIWFGWIIISCYFLFAKRAPVIDADKTETIIE